MKATGGAWVWAMLALCAVLVLGAMTWLTRHVIGSERERAVAEARADLQERVRLSLWRMDAAGAAIIVEENQRPAGDGQPAAPSELVKMRFELSETGGLSASDGEENLPQLKRLLGDNAGGNALFSTMGEQVKASSASWEAKKEEPSDAPQQQQKKASTREAGEQDYFSDKERAVRSKAVDNQLNKAQNYANAYPQEAAKDAAAAPAAEGGSLRKAKALTLLEVGPMRPAWIGGELFLLRKVVWSAGSKSIQGVWLDAGKLKQSLLDEVRDLLPSATLAAASQTAPDGMVLASFPWRLEPGERPIGVSLPRPIAISLFAGWLAAVLAILAAAILLRGVLRLSERRASFVSAVTHELRTPLTTFRLYSDMLEAGVVKEEKRGDYLRVLSHEADRLSHLVENVLAFSQIERGSARAQVRQTTARELIAPLEERFASRLATAGLELECNLSSSAAQRLVRCDAAAVEHVLFNLIDNAAKYAVGSSPPRVVLDVEDRPGRIAIRVCDGGPGIPLPERKKIFRAFHKSAREAAESKPGVGLGLALSRRLARSMHGDLCCEESGANAGACFVLSLPTV